MKQGNDIYTTEEEATYLHQAIFGFAPTKITIDRYVRFLCTLGLCRSCSTTATVVARKLDVEAVAAALRLRGPHHPLEQRIHGLLYICESQSEYRSFFYQTRTNRVQAWLTLFGHVGRTIWKSFKGSILLRYYGLL